MHSSGPACSKIHPSTETGQVQMLIVRTLNPALPTPRLATSMHARDYRNRLVTKQVENRERKSPQQSPPNLAMNDRECFRIRGD